MDSADPSGHATPEHTGDATVVESESAKLAGAAMALLGCRNSDEVYGVIGDFMALLCPDAVIITNEVSPDGDFFITRKIAGMERSLLARGADLIGFEVVGRPWPIPAEFRPAVLSGTLTQVPGGFAELTSADIPRTMADAISKAFGLHDLFTVGISDGKKVLGNIAVVTRTPDVGLPAHVIDSFAHQCYSTLVALEADRALQASEERYRAIAGTITSFVYSCEASVDEPYRIDWMAGAVEEVTGYTVDEVRERTCWRFMVVPEDRPVFDANVVDLEPGQAARAEFRIARRDGEVRWIRSTAQAAAARDHGAPHRLFGGCEDITERKAAQQELEERNRFIEAVLENAPIGFAVNTIDDGLPVLVSPSFEQIYGVDAGTLGGVGDFFERVYRDAEVRETMRERIMADLASGDPARMRWEDIPIVSGTGETRYVTALNIPLPDQNLMISTVQDVTARKHAEEEVVEQKARVERTLTSVIDIASTIVETRDPYTAGHQQRVSQVAARIAGSLGMSEAEIAEIEFAARIHDVGKVQVPAEILGKPGAISPLEYEILKGHAEAGYHIVSSARIDEAITAMVHQHHERCDGSGYPQGLTREQMTPGARVLAVADVVEAMMSHRPYRPALGLEAALAEIERGAGTLYDSEVAAACIALFRENEFVFT